MRRWFCNILFVIVFSFSLFPQNISNSQIVDKIANIMIVEYENYSDKSFTQRFVLKLGRRAFIDGIRTWQMNYENVATIPIKLHYQLNNMAKIVDEHGDEATAKEFRRLLTDLVRIGYLNLDIYYRSVRKIINMNDNIVTSNINQFMIDYAVADLEFYNEKIDLYNEEQCIKDRMRQIMNIKTIKRNISFYKFAFEFFDKIRVKIIQEDLDKVKTNMERKNMLQNEETIKSQLD